MRRVLLSTLGAILLSLGMIPTPVLAVERWVPTDFETIQAAIDASSHGDTVTVRDSTYTGEGNKHLDFGGRNILVRSENGPLNCTIDCENDGRGFYFHSGELDTACLTGFTIVNGAAGCGAGIWIQGCDPTIYNCVIKGCVASGDPCGGAGLFITQSHARINNCWITENTLMAAYGEGAGILCVDAHPVIENCALTYNSSSENQSKGGGIMCDEVSSPLIVNCLIAHNSLVPGDGEATGGGGIMCAHDCIPTIINCTIADNEATIGGGIGFFWHCGAVIQNSIVWGNIPDGLNGYDYELMDITYSDVQGWWEGDTNIHQDPQFIDVSTDDYRLHETSRCIDAGSNEAVPGDIIFDLDGNLRIRDGDGDNVETVDMGAYECYPWLSLFMVTIDAYCDDEDVPISVPVVRGQWGCPMSYPTPHVFENLTDLTLFTVPNRDPSDHLFREWSNGHAFTWIFLSEGGADTARYGGGGGKGACCRETGPLAEWECVNDVTDDECQAMDGIYLGDGTECDMVDCNLAVCCLPDETCLMADEIDCGTQGGIWHGDWNSCDPNPCAAEAVEDELESLGLTALLGVRPNPFQGTTDILFQLASETVVEVSIYDAGGRLVQTLASQTMSVGEHQVTWDGHLDGGGQAGAGVYLCRFRAGEVKESVKIFLYR